MRTFGQDCNRAEMKFGKVQWKKANTFRNIYIFSLEAFFAVLKAFNDAAIKF